MNNIITSEEFVACFGMVCFTVFVLCALYFCAKRNSEKELPRLNLTPSYQTPPPPQPSVLSNGWHTKTKTKYKKVPDFIILHWQDGGEEISIRVDTICAFYLEKGGHVTVQYGTCESATVRESYDDIMETLRKITGGCWYECEKEEED